MNLDLFIKINIFILITSILVIIIIFCLSSCTTSISFVHSEGSADGLIDGIQQTTPAGS